MSFLKFFYDEETLKKIQFLKRIRLFENIKEKDLIHVLENLVERLYLKGETIFTRGDIGRALYIIFSGKVNLTVYDRQQEKNAVLAEVHPGEIFGEMALLEEMPRVASAVAAEDTKVFILFKPKLENILISRPAIGVHLALELAKILSSRLRNRTEDKEAEPKL